MHRARVRITLARRLELGEAVRAGVRATPRLCKMTKLRAKWCPAARPLTAPIRGERAARAACNAPAQQTTVRGIERRLVQIFGVIVEAPPGARSKSCAWPDAAVNGHAEVCIARDWEHTPGLWYRPVGLRRVRIAPHGCLATVYTRDLLERCRLVGGDVEPRFFRRAPISVIEVEEVKIRSEDVEPRFRRIAPFHVVARCPKLQSRGRLDVRCTCHQCFFPCLSRFAE